MKEKRYLIEFMYPEQAAKKICPVFSDRTRCIGPKCMGWIKMEAEKEIIEITAENSNPSMKVAEWDGKLGGDPKLIKTIEQKKYVLGERFLGWNDKKKFVARWFLYKKKRKGFCVKLLGKPENR